MGKHPAPDPAVPGTTSDAASGTRRPFWKRRRVLVLFILLVLPCLLLLAVGWFSLDDERLAGLARRGLSSVIASPVQLDLHREGLGLLELRNLHVEHGLPADSGSAFLQLDRLGFYGKPGQLVQRRIHLDSLVVAGCRLQLLWRDSLLLPGWLLTDAEPAAPASDSLALAGQLAQAFAGLEPLAERGFSLGSTTVIFRDLRLSLEGSQAGQPLDLSSPALNFSCKLPALENAQLRELATGKLPAGLLAEILLDWSGAWQERVQRAGDGLRPVPMPLDLLQQLHEADLLLALRGDFRQTLDAGFQIVRDTLSFRAALHVSPREIHLSHGADLLPLSDSLSLRFDLSIPLAVETPELAADLEMTLHGAELTGRGNLTALMKARDTGWRLRTNWDQLLEIRLDSLAALLPSHVPVVLAGRLSMQLSTRADLDLDSGFQPGAGRLTEDLLLEAPQVRMPFEALWLDSVRLEQHVAFDFELDEELLLADPLLKLDMVAGIRELPGMPAGVDVPDAFELALLVSGAGMEDSLRAALDLALPGWMEGRVDLSASAVLPSLAEWIADAERWLEQPGRFQELPLSMDVESSWLRVTGLQPELEGELRLSARLWTESGLKGWLEVTPQAAWQLDEESIELPFVRAGFEAGFPLVPGDPPLPDEASCSLVLQDLKPIEVEWRMRDAIPELSFRADALRLKDVLGLVPAGLVPSGFNLEQGTIWLDGHVTLDSLLMPRSVSADLVAGALAFSMDDLRADGLQVACSLLVTPDRMVYHAAGDLRELQLVQPRWSWTGFDFLASGELELPEAPDTGASLIALADGAAAESTHRLDLEIESVELRMELQARLQDLQPLAPAGATLSLTISDDRLLRPWPGLVMQGLLDCRLEWEYDREADAGICSGLLGIRLDSLRMEDIWLAGLELELPFRQPLSLLPAPQLEVESFLPPYDWNQLRARDRQLADFGARSRRELGRGWNLTLARAGYEEWQLTNMSADLVFRPGILECPEFRFELLGGAGRGSFSLHDPLVPQVRLDCALIGLDSRRFGFAASQNGGNRERINAIVSLEGSGTRPEDWEQLKGRLRMPDLEREVTINLLRALDAQGIDPSIGRVRKLLELPGFRYGVESVDFDMDHGFVRPRVALRKSPFSPLPDVTIPMSPLPLRYLVSQLDLAGPEGEIEP